MDDRWNTCSECKSADPPYKLVGYYYTEALCNNCLEKDAIKCNRCRKILGYVIQGQMRDSFRTPGISCHECALK